MVRVMIPSCARHTIRRERNFYPDKELASSAFGTIKSAKNSIASLKRFGWRLKIALEAIPHLHPLPLKKGEETENKAARADTVRNRIFDPSPPRSRRGRG